MEEKTTLKVSQTLLLLSFISSVYPAFNFNLKIVNRVIQVRVEKDFQTAMFY